MPPKLVDGTPLSFRQDNPKRAGTKAFERYERYKAGKTLRQAIDLGALRSDVTNDVKLGFCALVGAGVSAAVPVAPVEPLAKRARVAGVPAKVPAVASFDPPLPSPARAVSAHSLPSAASAPSVPTPMLASVSASAGSTSSAPSKAISHDVDLSFVKLDGRPLKYARRMLGEAKRLLSSNGLEEAKKGGYSFSLLDRDHLEKWAVRLSDLNPDGRLAKDLARHRLDVSIDLEISVPNGFPLEPPFARVVYPQLSGGYVFSRGGICFEPLTTKGWVPSMTLSALAIAIKGILDYGDVRVSGEGNRATRTVAHYTEEGARKDHQQIVSAHKGGDGNTYGALKYYSS